MYGTQTPLICIVRLSMFENDVKMYGTQTIAMMAMLWAQFENDVKMFKMWKSIEIHWIW